MKKLIKSVKNTLLMNNGVMIRGQQLLNANGAIDPATAGYQYAIDTLSEIKSQVIEQKFYKISL